MKDPKKLKEKSLGEIRPAKGVKLKSKSQMPEKPKPEKPRIIQNVPDAPNVDPPTEDAVRIIAQTKRAKEELIEAMREFNKLLSDPKLMENKSGKEKEQENVIINELIRSAQFVDSLTHGEGIMSLCVFATRLSLSLRNLNNKLSHKNYLLEKRVENLEKSIGVEPPKEDPKSKEKLFLLEQAEKLGIKINIEGEYDEKD